jgi:hypothetical protein
LIDIAINHICVDYLSLHPHQENISSEQYDEEEHSNINDNNKNLK